MADVRKSDAKESMGIKIVAGIAIAVVGAVVGYAISYLDQHRKDQVAFISTQIEKLYGPLFALVNANDEAWESFHLGYWNDRKSFFQTNATLKPAEIDLWRRWMREVFQPMNIKMESALVNNAQLLVGEQMPPMFVQFLSHTEAYRSVIAKWSPPGPSGLEDASAFENVSPVPFPDQPYFSNCISEQFHVLKALQQTLQQQFVGSLQPLNEEMPAACRHQKGQKEP